MALQIDRTKGTNRWVSRTLSVACGLALSLAATSAHAAQRLFQPLSPQQLAQLEARYLDQAIVIAGDQVITSQQLGRQLQGPSYRAELEKLRRLPLEEAQGPLALLERKAAAELVEIHLATQAGQDRGFDPNLVNQLADRRFRADAERNGGYQAFLSSLKRSGMTPDAYKDNIRQQLYRLYWQGAITGRQPGTTGRKEIDRYVRPGEIRKTYRNFQRSRTASERELVGLVEASFTVREIGIGFEARGGRKTALQRADALRLEFTEGRMTMEDMVKRWGEQPGNENAEEDSMRTWSLSQATVISQENFGSARFLEFLKTAKVGEISQPFESPTAVHLFQLAERQDAQTATPFETWEVQEELRQHLLGRRDSRRLGKAFGQLLAENSLSDEGMTQFMLDPTWLERDRSQ